MTKPAPSEIRLPKKITLVPIEQIKTYENNSRTHSQDQIDDLVELIKRYGWTQPVLLDKDFELIAGEGRYMAANQLGLRRIPAIVLDQITPEDKRALVIADNQMALNSSWDLTKLRCEVKELKALDYDLSVLGFSSDYLEDLTAELKVQKKNRVSRRDAGRADKVTCPHCGKKFEVE